MFTVVRYLPIPRDLAPPAAADAQTGRRDTLVDISLLLHILNPTTTPEEEAQLRRLRAARAPEPFGPRPRLCLV
jgi:hypothetical protein